MRGKSDLVAGPGVVEARGDIDDEPHLPANGEQPATGTVGVTLGTSIGDLKFNLDRSLAPCTVNNFINLAKQKYFDNTTCHRLVVTGIQVLQCGDPGGNGMGGPGYSFKDEVYPELTYGRGVLAMANSGPDTNGSQFFIVYGDGANLKPAYTVFGTVVMGFMLALVVKDLSEIIG